MFKSRELSNLQQRVAQLEKQLKSANADSTKLKGELKAATAKVQRYKAALDDLSAAVKAKAAEGEDEEPAPEDDEEPSAKKKAKAEGEDTEDEPVAEGEGEDEGSTEDDAEDDAESEDPAAEDSEEEDKTMKKSKASLALLNRIPGKASINKQVEKKAAKVVTSRLAAAGVDPVKRDPAASEKSDGKQKADASLPPRQRATAAMSNWKVFGKN